MRKKIILILIVISVFIFLQSKFKNQERKIITINNKIIEVEVAKDYISRGKGLSDRQNLSENSGMLFIFPKSDYYYFWMKQMNFPLDFLWINGNKIVDISKNIPPPETGLSQLPTFTSKSPADKVLEINAGLVTKWNIKTGDEVKYNL